MMPIPSLRHDRRSFLARSLAFASATGCATNLPARAQSGGDDASERERPVCIFAKHLQLMPWEQLASFCREIDVDGIEATVRRGGQIEPADVIEQLPRLCEAMAQHDTGVVIMTTDINQPDSPHAESVLRTAALLGVKHYRMAYYQYDLGKPILPQLDTFARQAESLAAMNHELGLTGLYQNHAGGNYVGAPLWDLNQVLAEIPAADLGIAYDVRHASVEGQLSWPIDLAMIRDRIRTVYVKDYWVRDGRIENVPLGQGNVSDALFESLRLQPPPGPVSLHMEYISHTDPERVTESADAYRRDRQELRRRLNV